MGVGVSNWRLASAVAQQGQLGVVSGTAMSHVLAARLNDGDPTGDMREALANFPFQAPVLKFLKRYFVEGGRREGEPYKSHPLHSILPSAFLDQMTVMANFVEVFLAKRGHDGIVGINLLEKIQLPTPASLYGAMLAGVDYVLMGAGIPTQVAGMLDKLAKHDRVYYRLDVKNADRDDVVEIELDPHRLFPGVAHQLGLLKRPKFVPIISSAVLGMALIKRSEGSIDGFVVEAPIAGGHNAPPRGKMNFSEDGEPIYGAKDEVDFSQIAKLGKPFWLAGGYGREGGLKKAKEAGAVGIQVGTAFSLCEESGIEDSLNADIVGLIEDGKAKVVTRADKSPTGFPFKIATVPGTMSEREVFDERTRVCDVGMLRTLAVNEDGVVEYRCPSEPVADFVRKGGTEEGAKGRTCLCNNLLATIGIAKPRKSGYVEAPIVTSGDDLPLVKDFIQPGKSSFTAADVLDKLLS